MNHLKAFSLAIVAAVAMTAIAAPAAPAASFHSEASATTLSGSQRPTHVLNMDIGELSCETVTFAGSQNGTTSETWTITPTYKECTLATIFGPIAVTMNFNGCDYKFNANGLMHIECSVGKTIIMSGPGCTHTIPAQTVPNAISYSNTGSGSARDIDATFNISELEYSYSGFTCGSGSGTKNGDYIGTATFSGSAGIWWG